MRSAATIALAGCAAALLLADTSTAPVYLTATTANVAGAPDQVRFEILRWSSDEERDRLMAAWELRPDAGGAGKGKAGKGAAAAKGAAAGKGGAKGAPAAAAPVQITPQASLARALEGAPTVGYLWSSELAGYALRYAGRVPAADGSQRVVLVTQRRLGAMNQQWAPPDGTPNDYEFSLIELRLNSKGEGEGRASLTGKIAPDGAAKFVTLESGQPVVFQNVKPAKQQGAK